MFDSETKDLLTAPRCGVRDVDPEASPASIFNTKRKKRWSRLGGQTWDKMPVTIGYKNYWQGPMSKDVQDNVLIGCAKVRQLLDLYSLAYAVLLKFNIDKVTTNYNKSLWMHGAVS